MAKKNNYSSKKPLVIIIICIIFATVVLGVMLNILNDKTTENSGGTTTSNTKERDTDYERPDIISPMQKERLFKEYKGQIKENDVLESLTKFVYYITDNKQKISNMTEEEIEKDYMNNSTKYRKMGILTSQYYKYIANLLKDIEKEKLELSYTQFDTNTIEKIENGIIMKFNIKYVGIDEIGLKLILYTNNNNQSIGFKE